MTDYFHLNLDRGALLSLSALGLAHLGDGVYEVMAPEQPRQQEPEESAELTEEEKDVFRRGRNTDPHSVPKAASRAQYQTATGLEALFGWLYLQGKTERLNELFSVMMEEEVSQ